MGKKVLIPVPVPIYVPAPMHMYSSPYPVPVPFPLPVPVPIFIPTTRNSAHGIMKEIKVSFPFLVCVWADHQRFASHYIQGGDFQQHTQQSAVTQLLNPW
jgi:hypothetical protein